MVKTLSNDCKMVGVGLGLGTGSRSDSSSVETLTVPKGAGKRGTVAVSMSRWSALLIPEVVAGWLSLSGRSDGDGGGSKVAGWKGPLICPLPIVM